jgi:xanthine phosphoribosyltransferase
MNILKERILAEGKVLAGNILNVGSFLNQQVDVGLYDEIGKELRRIFDGVPVTRILTIEASGIGIACMTARHFMTPQAVPVPVIFARKFRAKNIGPEVYSTTVSSYTHGIDYTITVPTAYLHAGDSVLLIDDFLANGCALDGLVELVNIAGARVAGAGSVSEKGFQNGGKRLRERGIRVESLAIIKSMSPETGIVFAD